jgi:hypothetical protein
MATSGPYSLIGPKWTTEVPLYVPLCNVLISAFLLDEWIYTLSAPILQHVLYKYLQGPIVPMFAMKQTHYNIDLLCNCRIIRNKRNRRSKNFFPSKICAMLLTPFWLDNRKTDAMLFYYLKKVIDFPYWLIAVRVKPERNRESRNRNGPEIQLFKIPFPVHKNRIWYMNHNRMQPECSKFLSKFNKYV